MRLFTILLLVGTSVVAQSPEPTDAQGWVDRGIQAYRGHQWMEAVASFQRAVALDPSDLTAHRYLATSDMTLYVPGVDAAENKAYAEQARAEFQVVLQMNPADKPALVALANLSYQEAQGLTRLDEKIRKLDESADWNQKLLAVDPQNKVAYYSLAVIAWVKWYPAYMGARAGMGMRPADPGPFRDDNERMALSRDYGQSLAEGIADLEKALTIDPQYDDAMAYMNLLIRQRADLRATEAEYKQDVAVADEWVQRSLETKKLKAMKASQTQVGSGLQQNDLVFKVDPVYPPLAKQARVQGTVRFTAIIGKDGAVRNVQLRSGHPLLVAAALEAVKQWRYRPTLIDGQPVEVATQIDVPFSLSQ